MCFDYLALLEKVNKRIDNIICESSNWYGAKNIVEGLPALV
jgi:hypothetical protein